MNISGFSGKNCKFRTSLAKREYKGRGGSFIIMITHNTFLAALRQAYPIQQYTET